LKTYDKRAAQHLLTVRGEYILTNNDANNIDVLRIVSENSTDSDSSNTVIKTIDIQGKGMVCSLVFRDVIYIGCRDGILLELCAKNFELTKEMATNFTISCIAQFNDNTLIIAHTIGTGYLDSRAKITVVSVKSNDFEEICSSLVATGDINKILVSTT